MHADCPKTELLVQPKQQLQMACNQDDERCRSSLKKLVSHVTGKGKNANMVLSGRLMPCPYSTVLQTTSVLPGKKCSHPSAQHKF